jgi:hypothetical protein
MNTSFQNFFDRTYRLNIMNPSKFVTLNPFTMNPCLNAAGWSSQHQCYNYHKEYGYNESWILLNTRRHTYSIWPMLLYNSLTCKELSLFFKPKVLCWYYSIVRKSLVFTITILPCIKVMEHCFFLFKSFVSLYVHKFSTH